MIEQLGKKKRVEQILGHGGKAFIVPLDDLLISGPDFQLAEYTDKIPHLKNSAINAVLGFPGTFGQFYNELNEKPWIINLTTSTIRQEHTTKRRALSLKYAIAMGCTAVASHVNITAPKEGKMIKEFAELSCECQDFGIPLMAIIYARTKDMYGKDDNYLHLWEDNRKEYTRLVAHACRIAVELGADIIKTNFTGDKESFERVIYAAGNVPVVIAGGQLETEENVFDNIRGAMQAGAAGICFGRNLFFRDNIPLFIEKVQAVIDEYRV